MGPSPGKGRETQTAPDPGTSPQRARGAAALTSSCSSTWLISSLAWFRCSSSSCRGKGQSEPGSWHTAQEGKPPDQGREEPEEEGVGRPPCQSLVLSLQPSSQLHLGAGSTAPTPKRRPSTSREQNTMCTQHGSTKPVLSDCTSSSPSSPESPPWS